jgi:hypothetical protein
MWATDTGLNTACKNGTTRSSHFYWSFAINSIWHRMLRYGSQHYFVTFRRYLVQISWRRFTQFSSVNPANSVIMPEVGHGRFFTHFPNPPLTNQPAISRYVISQLSNASLTSVSAILSIPTFRFPDWNFVRISPLRNIWPAYLIILYFITLIIRGLFERFVDWRQYAAVMQREAVTVMPSCSGESSVVVAWSSSL